MPDDDHSEHEERWLLLGANLQEKIAVIMHAYRYNDVIRIISARTATSNKKQTYLFEAKKMKDEYDFSRAEQGKFYVPVEDIQIPIYLDKDVMQFLTEKCHAHPENLQDLVNDLLHKDIEIAQRVA